MEIDLLIKNYRCFRDENPARLRVANGFTAFLGQNNSGKTALLRFFYEFRDLFARLAEVSGLFQAVRGQVIQFNRVQTHDSESIFARTTGRPLTIEITLDGITFALLELTMQRGNTNP